MTRTQRFAGWWMSGLGLAFWVFVILAFARSSWYWVGAGVLWICCVALKLAGARDVLGDLLASAIVTQKQTAGDGSTNMQAGHNLTVPTQVAHPVGPTADRGQFWTNLGVRPELAVDREARERGDYELVKARLASMANHPAGKARTSE